jgi:hypothetical protein
MAAVSLADRSMPTAGVPVTPTVNRLASRSRFLRANLGHYVHAQVRVGVAEHRPADGGSYAQRAGVLRVGLLGAQSAGRKGSRCCQLGALTNRGGGVPHRFAPDCERDTSCATSGVLPAARTITDAGRWQSDSIAGRRGDHYLRARSGRRPGSRAAALGVCWD